MIIAVSGYKGAGKTTFIDELLPLLGGYDVLTIKDTNMDEIDTRGKDSYRHSEAGAYASAIIAGRETAIFFNGRREVEEISAMVDADVVLLEGFKHSGYPKIWLGEGDGENVVMRNPSVGEAYNYIVKEVEKERVLEKLPRIDCGECGHKTCGEMAEAIVNGEATLDDCHVLKKKGVKVTVNGKALHLNKFVAGIAENTIRGMLSPLKGGENVEKGEISIKLPAKRV